MYIQFLTFSVIIQTNTHSSAEVWKEKYCCTFYVKMFLIPSILKYPYVGHTNTWLAFWDWNLDASTNFYNS